MQIFLHVWAIAGPLVGILLGGWLTTKNQRKLWLLDHRRAEYRELLTTLSDWRSHCAIAPAAGDSGMTPRHHRLMSEATRKLANVVANRLFIAAEVKRIGIEERCGDAYAALKEGCDGRAFENDLGRIMDDIRKAAHQDFS